jgi:hypothetical protein
MRTSPLVRVELGLTSPFAAAKAECGPATFAGHRVADDTGMASRCRSTKPS